MLVQREKLAQASGREDVLNLALAKLKSQGMLIAGRTGTGVTMQKRLPGVRDKLRFVLFKRAFIENVVAFREADKAEN